MKQGLCFLREFEDTDAVFLTGAVYSTIHFVKLSLSVLALLEMALNRGLPVALFSQGIGPIENPTLRNRAAEILPRVRSIFIRDNDMTPALLDRLGVAPKKITFTGDDAVALAWENQRNQIGSALGFNLRLSTYSGVTEQTLTAVREVLQPPPPATVFHSSESRSLAEIANATSPPRNACLTA